MKQYPTDRVRTIGLFGHGGSGKTSLVEALLFDAHVTTRLGRVDEGNTVTDFDPDEIKRRMSVSLGVAPLEWRDTKINLIDVPGYADFTGEVRSALRVCDAAIVVIDASSGVQVGTEQVWDLIEERGIPKLIFINRMERENADYDRSLAEAREHFGKAVAPIQFPLGKHTSFRGIVDLLAEEAWCFQEGSVDESYYACEIPTNLKETCSDYHKPLIESIAEHNEELTLRYLDDEPIDIGELREELTRCVRDGSVTPVLCGSAITNRGMNLLLDAMVDLLPSAAESVEVGALNGKEETINPDPNGPLVALPFKTLADPHVGRVTLFRVMRGAMKSNSQVLNASRGETERIGQVFSIRGKEHLNTDQIVAGDIGAVAKLTTVVTGDTITDPARPVVLHGIEFPEACYSTAVHPKSKTDLDKLGVALQRLVEEDPTLTLSRDPATGEAILSGLGEPHVQIALDRMSRRFGVNVDLALPRVPYREAITGKTIAEHKHKKQTGGAGQYGHVFLELEPLADGDFEFGERVFGGAVPRNFYPAVEKGVRDGLEHGPLAGYPVVNVKVTLTDGSYHAVDSNEMAFRLASKEAFRKGMLQANPVLLEPVMTVRVTVPDGFTGDVMSDLNTKRAQVSGMTQAAGGTTVIEALAPAAEIQRYATDLRSLTQGRGSFSSGFSHYQPAPPHVAEQIKAASRAREAA